MKKIILLWIALNPEPDDGRPVNGHVQWGSAYHSWLWEKLSFIDLDILKQVSYFESEVRRRSGFRLYLEEELSDSGSFWVVLWYSGSSGFVHEPVEYEEEPDARILAAARALHALGAITDEKMTEIEDAPWSNNSEKD